MVHSLIFDPATRRVTGVRVIDAQTQKGAGISQPHSFSQRFCARVARILLNSATTEFPNGLANSSGELGHNVMDHIMGGGAKASFPAMKIKEAIGHRPNGIYMPRFRNIKAKEPISLRGYGFQGGAWREELGSRRGRPGFRRGFQKSKLPTGRRGISRSTDFGECLPKRDNYVGNRQGRNWTPGAFRC